MAQGGARKGAGRPKGSINSISMKAKAAAAETGELPHQWLLRVSRGEPIEQKRWEIERDEDGRELSRMLVEEVFYAPMDMRIDAAKAAAPFYAPKLAVQQIGVGKNDEKDVVETLRVLADNLPV